jgi:hypothetical protein
MVPMHEDLSFSSVVSKIMPSVRNSGFRTPSCRGRSKSTSSRFPGRIGDVVPDFLSETTYIKPALDCVEAESSVVQQNGDSTVDESILALEIDIVRDNPFVILRILTAEASINTFSGIVGWFD